LLALLPVLQQLTLSLGISLNLARYTYTYG